MTKNTTTTKAQYAAEASAQLAYILSALGIEQNYDATTALLAALQSSGSLKCAAETLADVLRTVKVQIRANVNALEHTTTDRNATRADNRQLVTSRDFWKAKAEGLAGHLRDVIGDRDAAREAERFWHREAEDLGTAYTSTDPVERPRAPCGCDTEREFCNLCAMPDPRDTTKAESSLIEDHAKARRRAARQAADDADRARDRSFRRQTIRDRDAKLAKGPPVVAGYPYCTTCGGTERVSDGGHGQDEGSLCAHCGGAATTKIRPTN